MACDILSVIMKFRKTAMTVSLRSAISGVRLIRSKYALESVMVPFNSFHTTAECMKQRNPFSLAEAGVLKLKGKEVKKRTIPSEHRLTGTNDVIYRKNLPRVFHSWETGVAYLKSQTYYSTYGDLPVWTNYRRNFRGGTLVPRARPSCFTKDNRFTLNNPCPLCRDEYLVVDYRNPELLKQFLNRLSGEILDIKKTGLCEYQHDEVRVHVLLASNHGYLAFDVPFRNYDYRHYYPSLANESDEEAIKALHLVNVPDKPEPYPDKRPYPFVKYPIHAPMVISDYEL